MRLVEISSVEVLLMERISDEVIKDFLDIKYFPQERDRRALFYS